ncbi:hypothetical protein PHMEG_00010024 [Phytophthora megakarya]|uniref:Uncharacterized protein n=1 Tax=Phytophthora megakarya TaxID=4795 RepID=A0A225WEQ5_9STRA|nr:hypothetical protein PHMEG_00010024 [Phytophthora megakarya]
MHTGVAIARGLEDMLVRRELRPDMCTILLRDGASNAVLGNDILGVRNHKDTLAQVRGDVQSFRALAIYFHKSTKATYRLNSNQGVENICPSFDYRLPYTLELLS